MPSSGDIAAAADVVSRDDGMGITHASMAVRRKSRGKFRRKLRQLGLVMAAAIPIQGLKKGILRYAFGYRIGRNVRIGAAYLDCERLTIGDHTHVSSGTAVLGCLDVEIGSYVLIGPLNLIRGGDIVRIGDYAQILRMNVINAIPDNDCTNHPDPTFILGYGSVVTAEHRIDFTDRVTIGRCTTFGGRNSSIWTHNRRSGAGVEIGDYCYIGSEIRMAPGTRIPHCCVVGIGAVVTKPMLHPYSLIGGVPAKRIRGIDEDDKELIFGKTRKDLPDESYPLIPDDGTLIEDQVE